MVDRNKAYPGHRDPFAFTMGTAVYRDQYESLMADGPESFRQAFDANPFPKVPRFYRKMKPNFNDPMTLFYLLDALIESAPGTYIRPSYLVPWLNNRAPMYYWTTDLVGRMLAGLWESCIENYLDEEDDHGMEYIPKEDGDGEEIPEEKRKRMLPFALGRDSHGKYYVVDPQGTYEGRFWLIKFRQIAIKLCYDSMNEERDGNMGANMAKERTPFDYYIGISPDPILSAQAYRASYQAPLALQNQRNAEEGIIDVFSEE